MFDIDETHDPALRSWVPRADAHADFPVQNLPLGIFSRRDEKPGPGVAIGDSILDLQAIATLLPEAAAEALQGDTLNGLFALPSAQRRALRGSLSRLLTDTAERGAVEPFLHQSAGCTMHLPASIGDYSDFYVGIHHARSVGALFRAESPLMPNYKWVPIGYHGRASSIRPSGDPVTRPNGQRLNQPGEPPEYGPARRLDYELEMGIWVGTGNTLGQPIAIADAPDHIVGLCLLNDWSARDLQTWEYQPLGPFLAKSFQTTISPWVITAEALAPFRVAQPVRPLGDPSPLPYLQDTADQDAGAFSVQLEVRLSTRMMRDSSLPSFLLSTGPMTSMYWTIAQILAHQTSNGCNIRAGDLLGTGTISAPTRKGSGCLLEMTQSGKDVVTLPNGETRTFLEDGDEVTITATARAEGYTSIGFGMCRAVVNPAIAI